MVVRIAVCIALCVYTVSSYGCCHDLYAKLRKTYDLYTPSDYRPAINTQDFYGPRSRIHDQRSSEYYDAAALILGYKDILHIDARMLKRLGRKHPEIVRAILQEAPYYAVDLDGNTLLLYRERGAYKALLILEKQIDTRINENTTKQQLPWQNIYIMGTCLSYPEQDIHLFCQRSEYMNKKNISPQQIDIAAFKQFIGYEWQLDPHLEQAYHQARQKIDTHMANDSLCNITSRIDEKHTAYENILKNVRYGCLSHELLSYAYPDNDTTYTLHVPQAPQIPKLSKEIQYHITDQSVQFALEHLQDSTIGEILNGVTTFMNVQEIIDQEDKAVNRLRNWAAYLQTSIHLGHISEQRREEGQHYIDAITNVLDTYDTTRHIDMHMTPSNDHDISRTGIRDTVKACNLSEISIHNNDFDIRRMVPRSQAAYNRLCRWHTYLTRIIHELNHGQLSSRDIPKPHQDVLPRFLSRIEAILQRYDRSRDAQS